MRDSQSCTFEAVRSIDRLEHSEIVILPATLIPAVATQAAYVFTTAEVLAFGAPQMLPNAYLAGARDFMKTPWEVEELLFRITRLAHSRTRSRSPERLRHHEMHGHAENDRGHIRLEPRLLRVGPRTIELNEEEYQVLQLFLSSEDGTVSRRALAFVMGLETRPGSRALDMRIARLRQHLRRALQSPNGGHNPIVAVRNRGYRWVPNDPQACG